MILITGATGTVSRPLVDALIGRGVAVRAISRSTTAPPAGVERVGAALPAGVEYVSADLARPESIAAALDGVSALFVHPRAVGESAGKLMAMAAETFVEVPPEAAAAGMVAHGIPDAFVTALMARYARGAGHPADITDEVERILGRPAHTFASWVADHSHEFLSA